MQTKSWSHKSTNRESADLWWDDGEAWEQSGGELSELCDVYSHWKPKVNEEDLYYLAVIRDCDLNTKRHFHMNVCCIRTISILSSQRHNSDSPLTSTLDHFPL